MSQPPQFLPPHQQPDDTPPQLYRTDGARWAQQSPRPGGDGGPLSIMPQGAPGATWGPPPKKGRPWLIAGLIVAVFVALLLFLGACLAVSTPSSGSKVSAAAPATQGTEPTTEPTTEPAEFTTTKADWTVKLKIRSKKCYGYGVGCNVEVVPKFNYSGPDIPEDTIISITYKIHGGEDGSVTETVDLDDQGKYSTYPEMISTRSKSSKLTVRITKVEVS